MALSIDQIATISDVAQKVTIAAGIVTVIASIIMFWADRVEKDNAAKEFKALEISAANAHEALKKIRSTRTISPEQLAALTILMTPFAGQKFTGYVATASTDSVSLWEGIAKALMSAGWVNVPQNSLSVGTPPATVSVNPHEGVRILVSVSDADRYQTQAFLIVKFLRQVGIEVEAHPTLDRKMPPDTIALEIGIKPL